MRWKIVLVMLTVCLTLGLCIFHSDAGAASKYMIKINKQKNTVTVYKNKSGTYKPYKAFVCSVGKKTPLGRFRIFQKHRWRPLVDSTYGQYCTRFVGHILFHSVWYHKPNPATLSNEEFNKLGTTASHGCIRLTVQDAKWIYDNCQMGTTVVIYNSKDPGPLGKPDAIKLPKGIGYDPTDIWSAGNPYLKKKPKITGAKNRTISYGDSGYDIMKGINAKNTTGFNVKKRVEVSIKYRINKDSSYKKVKKVDTGKPGSYRVTYQLTDEIGRKTKVTVIHKVLEKPIENKDDPQIEQTPAPVPTPDSVTVSEPQESVLPSGTPVNTVEQRE